MNVSITTGILAWVVPGLAILLPATASAEIKLSFGVYTSDKPFVIQ